MSATTFRAEAIGPRGRCAATALVQDGATRIWIDVRDGRPADVSAWILVDQADLVRILGDYIRGVLSVPGGVWEWADMTPIEGQFDPPQVIA